MVGVRNTWERVLELIQDNSYLEEKTGCFIYMGTETGQYRCVSCEGQQWLVHRLVYHKLVKPLVTNEVVRHLCDNPPCWNPDHLLDGSQVDNINDMMLRGRQCRGVTQHRAKLTEDQVREIRKLTHLKYEEVGRMYDIDPSAIRKIILGITWKHVE